MATVEIEADESSTTVIPSEIASDPDYQTCQNASGNDAIAACDRAIGSGKFSGHLLAALHVNRAVERKHKEVSTVHFPTTTKRSVPMTSLS